MKTTVRGSASLALVAGVVASLALGPRPASAQSQQVDSTSGLWLSVGTLVGGTLLDGNASRTWSSVGSPGPSVGGAFAAGLDVGRYGAAIDLEAATLQLGKRRANSTALTATLRWWPPLRRVSAWEPVIELGYVRFGVGGVQVPPAEVPPELFTSGVQRQQGPDDELSLHGGGIRMGMTVEHRFVAGSLLMLGLGADVVHFRAATYQGFEQSLTRPGWAFVPRTLLGVRMPLKLNVLNIGSGPGRSPEPL